MKKQEDRSMIDIIREITKEQGLGLLLQSVLFESVSEDDNFEMSDDTREKLKTISLRVRTLLTLGV